MITHTIWGEQVGANDNTVGSFTHIYKQTVATGARLANGDGDGLGLVVWEAGIGVINAGGFVSKIVTSATAARTLTLPDASGPVVLGDGNGVSNGPAFLAALGVVTVTLAADVTTTSNTPQAVAGLTVPLVASSIYQLRAVLVVKTASSGNGVRPSITGPASTVASITGIARQGGDAFRLNALSTTADFSGAISDNVAEIMTIEAVIITNGTPPASDLGLSFQSENDGNQVEILQGSALTLTKI